MKDWMDGQPDPYAEMDGIVIEFEDGRVVSLDALLDEYGVEATMEMLGLEHSERLAHLFEHYLAVIKRAQQNQLKLLECEKDLQERFGRMSQADLDEILMMYDASTAAELQAMFDEVHADEDMQPCDGGIWH